MKDNVSDMSAYAARKDLTTADARSNVSPSKGASMKVGAGIALYFNAHQHLLVGVTRQARRYTLEQFAAFVGEDTKLRSITSAHVTDWLQSKDVQASTMRKYLSTLRCYFTWAITAGYALSDPTVGVKTPRQPRPLPRALNDEEVAALYRVLPNRRAELIVSLMLHEGLRCIEVSRLEMSDLDLVHNVMRVLGKGSVEALLPITPPTRDALLAYFGERGRGAGPVIRSESTYGGIKSPQISYLVKVWMTDAGIKLEAFDGRSAHALRHTFASRLYDRQVDLQIISDALRHANPSTTWTYLRHRRSLETLRDVMGAA